MNCTLPQAKIDFCVSNTYNRLMNYRLVETQTKPYIECLEDGWQVKSESDALDLVAACGEYRANRLLLHPENFPPDFFQLRTGLAGAVLLKLSNYRIKVAAVLTPDQVGEGRFQEMALEANRRNGEFHIFY